MFREMRRNKQELTQEECAAVLERGTSGVLAVLGDEGYPYAVPLSYVYLNGKIYFHCAKSGHKLDAIKKESKVSFCVVDQDRVASEKYTTYFRSVIVFGQAHVLEDETEKRRTIGLLAEKYSPEQKTERTEQEIEQAWERFCMIELTAEHITGKEAIELVREKETADAGK